VAWGLDSVESRTLRRYVRMRVAAYDVKQAHQ